jgi:hypothetical protein
VTQMTRHFTAARKLVLAPARGLYPGKNSNEIFVDCIAIGLDVHIGLFSLSKTPEPALFCPHFTSFALRALAKLPINQKVAFPSEPGVPPSRRSAMWVASGPVRGVDPRQQSLDRDPKPCI